LNAGIGDRQAAWNGWNCIPAQAFTPGFLRQKVVLLTGHEPNLGWVMIPAFHHSAFGRGGIDVDQITEFPAPDRTRLLTAVPACTTQPPLASGSTKGR
jgi:hypothetical protein